MPAWCWVSPPAGCLLEDWLGRLGAGGCRGVRGRIAGRPAVTPAPRPAGTPADGTLAQDSSQARQIWHLREGITEGLRHRGAPRRGQRGAAG